MELRSRSALKVVWRSGEPLMCSFGKKGSWQSLVPRSGRCFWLSEGGERQEEAGQGLEDPRPQQRRWYRDLGNLPGPGGGGRVERPSSRRKRADSGNGNVPSTSSGLRCGTIAWPERGPRHSDRARVAGAGASPAGVTHRRRCLRRLRSRSTLERLVERSRVPASAGARRGAPRRPEKKPQRRAHTRRAGGGGGGARRSVARARKRRARRGGRSGGARWCGTAGRIAGEGALGPPTLPPPLTPTSAEKEGPSGLLAVGGGGGVFGVLRGSWAG